MLNIYDKRDMVDSLAVYIGYRTNILLTDEQEKFVWSLIDFGYSEDGILYGKWSSLQSSLHFDSILFEKKLDDDIDKLNSILNQEGHMRGECDV